MLFRSEYGLEQVYSVIDSRYRSGKPLIATTNLTLEELHDVVQQGLGVVPIRFTVAIEVTSSQLLLREDGLAPGSPGHIGVQGRCGQVHVLGQLGFILIAVGIAHKVILSEHIGRQGEGLCPVFQIVNLEGKLVLAPPLWVLAQLCLD